VVRVAAPSPNIVSRYDDPPDEILDLGRPGRRERSDSPESLPPLHIGDEPSGRDDGDIERVNRPRWWQWAILVVAVVAGLIVGVLGSNARRDAADLAAAESEVDLIVGAPVMVTAPDTPFQVPLYNAGALEVELLWIRPKGWTVAETATRHPITMPPNRWVPVRVRAIPDCTDFVSEDVVEMKVRTQARERVISLPLPMAGIMVAVHTSVCRSFNQLGAYVEDVHIEPPAQPDTLTMQLDIQPDNANLRFTLTDLDATAPGFRMIDTSLPVRFEPGAQSFPVDITWEVADCEATRLLDDIYLGLGFEEDDGNRQTGGAQLPGRGVAELARFGFEQCGPASDGPT
jgi:hypothetical protein